MAWTGPDVLFRTTIGILTPPPGTLTGRPCITIATLPGVPVGNAGTLPPLKGNGEALGTTGAAVTGDFDAGAGEVAIVVCVSALLRWLLAELMATTSSVAMTRPMAPRTMPAVAIPLPVLVPPDLLMFLWAM